MPRLPRIGGKKTRKVRAWKCKNCGEAVPMTPRLKELSFKRLGPKTTKVTCPYCGSYTIQKVWDDKGKYGQFLAMKTRTNHYLKGVNNGRKRNTRGS